MTILITSIVTFILTTIFWFLIGTHINKKMIKDYGNADIQPITLPVEKPKKRTRKTKQ